MMDADGLKNDTMTFYGRPTRAEKACINGNIYILKILYYFGPENFMRNKKLVYKASFYGYVNILEWLYSLY